MTKINITPEQVDALLPQTQCGQCEYAGCQPYAQAIIHQGEAINRCVPGGAATLLALSKLLKQDPAPYLDEVAAKEPPKVLARIRENECIGCTKCIQACPVDAIIGAAKSMHTVLTNECTGCGLCVEPCPVDCIDMQPIAEFQYDLNRARQRHQARHARIAQEQFERSLTQQQARIIPSQQSATDLETAKKRFIQEAVARARAKTKRQAGP